MRDEALRLRLEALNRGPLPAGLSVAPLRTGRPAAEAASPKRSTEQAAWRGGVVRSIPGLVRRGEAVVTNEGEHWRVALDLDQLWPGGAPLIARRLAALTDATSANGDGESDWLRGFPDATAILDLETCGLAGSAVFLAGILRCVGGQFVVELLLARDYSEESAILASLWQRLAGVGTIVTFNGKSFDWPMVVDRSRRHLLARGELAPRRHVDLLHAARRRWRRELPDCKLQTLERRICGRSRADVLPSNQIPAAYHHYVRTGFEREMDAILLHNAIDLVTMLDLAMRLA